MLARPTPLPPPRRLLKAHHFRRPSGALIMRSRVIAVCLAVFSIVAVLCIAAQAQERKSDVKGLFLLTDYPAVTVRPGATSTINLRLQNYDFPPDPLALSVSGVPSGWTATLL